MSKKTCEWGLGLSYLGRCTNTPKWQRLGTFTPKYFCETHKPSTGVEPIPSMDPITSARNIAPIPLEKLPETLLQDLMAIRMALATMAKPAPEGLANLVVIRELLNNAIARVHAHLPISDFLGSLSPVEGPTNHPPAGVVGEGRKEVPIGDKVEIREESGDKQHTLRPLRDMSGRRLASFSFYEGSASNRTYRTITPRSNRELIFFHHGLGNQSESWVIEFVDGFERARHIADNICVLQWLK